MSDDKIDAQPIDGGPASPTATLAGAGSEAAPATQVATQTAAQPAEGVFRRLWPSETDKFRDHLLRLKDSRRMRFAHAVADAFIEDYAGRMTEYGSVVYGYVLDGKVRAAAELRRLGDSWGEEAEAAFSVERAFQDHGIGSELMGRVVRAARNRSIRRLYIGCCSPRTRRCSRSRASTRPTCASNTAR